MLPGSYALQIPHQRIILHMPYHLQRGHAEGAGWMHHREAAAECQISPPPHPGELFHLTPNNPLTHFIFLSYAAFPPFPPVLPAPFRAS